MSITFYVEDTKEKPTPKKKMYCRDLYPSLSDEDFERDPFAVRDEHGYYELRSAWPEANFANSNAFDLLALLQLPYDDVGRIPNRDIAAVRRRILVLLNQDIQVAAEAGTMKVVVGGAGATSVYSANSSDAIQRRLNALSGVLEAAQVEGLSVFWS